MRIRGSSYRLLAVMSVVLLLLSGCNLTRRGSAPEQTQGSSNVGSGVKLPAELEQAAQQQEQQEEQQQQTPPPKPFTPEEKKRAQNTAPVEPPAPPAGAYVSAGEAVGIELSRRILGSGTPRLVIEVQTVEGTSVNAQALAQFVGYISSLVQKPGGVEVLPVKGVPRKADRYSGQHVFDTMSEHRTTDNNDPKVATVWILYVPDFNFGAAGVAWFGANGVIAMSHRAVTGPGAAAVGGATRMERAVLTHEFGHVMSLINLNYKSPRNHSDPRSPSHSSNKDSVMYYAVEMIEPGNVIQGGTPIEFDNDDKADLNDVRDGKLG